MGAEEIETPTPPVGVIESISRGFEIVGGYAPLLLLPLLLDLLLWIGPRISFEGAIAAMPDTGLTAALLGGIEERYLPGIGAHSVIAPLLQTAVIGSISTGALHLPPPARLDPTFWTSFGIPSLLVGRSAMSLPFAYVPPVWEIRTPAAMVGISLMLVVMGLIGGTAYMGMVVNSIEGRRVVTVERLPDLTVKLGAFNLIMLGVTAVIITPFIGVGTATALVSETMGQVILLFGAALAMFVSFFAMFTAQDILLHDRKILVAVWNSVRVIQWHFASTAALVVMIFIIDIALTQVWLLVGADSWLIIAGMVCKAFISAGLTTATFVYFKDRYRHWQEMYVLLLAELAKQRETYS